MSKEALRSLGDLMGAYFHQDWPEVYPSEAAALDAIVTDESREDLRKAASHIAVILNSGYSEAELAHAVSEGAGIYFNPESIGMNYTQWLKRVASLFEAA